MTTECCPVWATGSGWLADCEDLTLRRGLIEHSAMKTNVRVKVGVAAGT